MTLFFRNNAVQQDDSSPYSRHIIAILFFCIIFAIAITASDQLGRLQDGDSVITTIMSYYRVTLFYWGQNRMANVIPGLAYFVRDVSYNVEFQTFLHAFFGFFIILFPLMLIKLASRFAIFFISCAAAFILCSSYGIITLFVLAQPYGGGCFFFCLSLLFFDKATAFLTIPAGGSQTAPRIRSFLFLLAALLSSTVGMAMNPALLILVLPFYLLRSVLLLSIRDIVAAMVNICGFSITYWLMMRAGDDSYSSWALTWDHFVSAWQTMVKDGPLTIGPLLVLVLSATLITLRRTACSFFSRKITGQYTEVTRFSLVVASFVYIFFVINMGHAETGTAHRYIYWVIVALITISVDIHFEWLANFLIFRKDRAALLRLGERCLPAFGVILAISVILLRTAPWSERIHYLLVDSAIRPLAAVATAARTAFIVGDYWKTWPVVVETLAARQAAGEPRPLVFGMTFRGETVRDLADREFRQAASRSALCIDQSADQCAQQLLSIIPPFSWKECVTTVDAGQVPGASYTVIRLVREEAGQSCAGLEASSSWADLRSFARLTLSAYRQGNDIILPQEAPLGLTVYGPYLHLDPGHFNASWRLSVAAFGDGVTEDTPIAKVDIADKTGADLLGDRLLTRRDFKPGPDGYSATVTLPFRAKHPLEHLELRLFRLAPVTITLAGLSVASASD